MGGEKIKSVNLVPVGWRSLFCHLAWPAFAVAFHCKNRIKVIFFYGGLLNNYFLRTFVNNYFIYTIFVKPKFPQIFYL